jgi:hypothetical protein
MIGALTKDVRCEQQKPLKATVELEECLLAAANKPVTPLTRADFNSIRERVRTRHE